MVRFKGIFAIFISVFILSISIGNCFITTNNISRVYATEIVIEEVSAAAWELIVLFLAECGITGAILDNKDAIMELYSEKAKADLELGRFIVNGAKDGVMWVYDSVSDAVSSIPWDEYVEALKGYHDSAVDNLTGIYAKYCPELLGYTKEFVHDIATGALVIEGVNDNVFLDEELIDKQWSGEPFAYDMTVQFSYNYTHPYSKVTSHQVKTYDISFVSSVPVCAYIQTSEGYNGDVHVSNNYVFGLSYINEKGYLDKIQPTGIYSVSVDGVSSGSSSILGNQSISISENFNTNDYNHNLNISFSGNLPFFMIDSAPINSAVNDYLRGIIEADSAINWDGVIDNDDLPFWGLSKALSEVIARAPDIGIGSIGAGTLVNDWTDDIPFVGLTDIQDYIDKVNDVIDGIRDRVIDGTFDLTKDIPDSITDPYTDAWDDVIDNSIPSDDPRVKDPTKDKPTTGEKPITGDKPITVPSEDVIDLPLLVPDVASGFSDISDTLKTKFPFSLPWDLHYLLTGLASTPKTPVYYLPLVIERLGINETIVVDMSKFEELSRLSRAMLSFIWAYVLINWTVKIVSVRKEE